MCYHSQRAGTLETLEHETETKDPAERRGQRQEGAEAHSSDNPELTDRRPEPLGHA